MTPDEPMPSTAELWTLIQEQRNKLATLEAQVKVHQPSRPSRGRSSILLTTLFLVVLLVTGPALARSALPALADSSGVTTAVSTQQYTLAGSNGTTWVTMDATNLTFSLTPSVNSTVVLSANADLWTSSSGYNQDLGIAVTGGIYNGIVAWKESGGFAGTYSPNAALVHSVLSLTGGTTYTITLQWKANKADPGTIWAGAGAGSPFSPTRLTAQLHPNGAQPGDILQYNGTSWVPIQTFCPRCDKGSVDLSGQNLAGAYFPETSFYGANLQGTFLVGAYLNSTYFRNATMENAYLTAAYMANANFINANLYGVTLDGADLRHADLSNAYLYQATGGTSANVTGVIWSSTICPDDTNSNNDGYTCVGHGF